VQARRRHHAWAREITPPPVLRGGRPVDQAASKAVLRGHGLGPGRVLGRARVLAHLDDAAGVAAAAAAAAAGGIVLVVPALLAHAVHLLVGMGAVVTDHGGALSHAATLAREAGLPAVLGTRHATRRIRPGQQVLVDSDQGIVIPID
jgi:pyruvate,water dikinase